MNLLDKFFKRYWPIILITVTTKTILLLYSAYINSFSTNIFYPWVRWDGPHYIDLAKDWYQTTGVEALWIVFYPLYPLLIKIFNLLINDFQISAILVSLVFSFTAAIFLYELALIDFKRKVALLSVWFLNVFPSAYFLQASYTESLFLTLTLASIYFYRKNHFFGAGIFGALSSMTRVNGIFLLPQLLLEKRASLKTIITFFLTPLGFISYLLINNYYFGEFFYFTKPLLSNWYKKFEWPWIGITNMYNSIPPRNDPLFYAYLTEFLSLIFVFVLSFYVIAKMSKSYGVYMFLNLILFTSTSFVVSTPRYILALFPIYIVLATIKNKTIISLISLIFVALLFYFTQFYVKGQWAF